MELKLNRNKPKIFNVSKKEKNLLLILLIAVLGFLIYRFVFIPQEGKIDVLKVEKNEYDEELAKIDEIISRENMINKEWDSLNKDFEKLSSRFYQEPNQPDLIYILNDIVDNGKLEVSQMSFRDPEKIELDGMELNSLGVTAPFRGSFTDLEIFLSDLRSSEKRLLVDQLSISKDDGNIVNGQVAFNAFAYGGVKAKEDGYFYKNEFLYEGKSNPFVAYEGYVESPDYIEGSAPGSDERRTLLADLENNQIYFMGTTSDVTGKVDRVNIPKYGKTSIRAEYFISSNFSSERAYVVLDEQNILLKYPPQSIGVWAYSYSYSPVIVGMRFQDMDGNKIDMEIERGVNWIGWEYISATPPQDINLYPLQLDRIYMELAPNRDDYGILLFDRIEAAYPRNEDDTIVKPKYTYYMVKPGDTVMGISKMFYGSESQYLKLMKDNGITNSSVLEVGKVLVIQN